MNVIGVDIKPPLPTTTVDVRLRDAQANKRIDQMNEYINDLDDMIEGSLLLLRGTEAN